VSSGSDPAEIILQFVKRKGLKKVLFLGSNNKAKLANVIRGGGQVSAQTGNRTWQHPRPPHGFAFIEWKKMQQ
jgi:D-hexose-6-phosphate mutarotase